MRHIKLIPFDSHEYKASLSVRDIVLRKPLGIEFTPEQLFGEDRQYHIAYYSQAKKMLACLVLNPISTTILKMRQVAVLPNYQKQGIGTKMVSFCEKFALKNNYKQIELHARIEAVPFYERLDYEIIGDSFKEVNIVHYKMSKNIVDNKVFI